jgi:hypothetical protein
LKIPKLPPSNWISLLCAAGAVVIAILLLTEAKPWDIIAKFGPPKKLKQFVGVYGWWAGAANALLLLILAATARWWFRPRPGNLPAWLPSHATPKWFWPLIAVAMALTAWFGLQRISFSVWDDEERSLRQNIVGEYRARGAGEREYRAAKWEDAFWNYKVPTNHQLQTLISKTSHTIWTRLAPNTTRHFQEPVLRWPLLVAAVASIAALALLLKTLGFPRAAVVAAFLLAVHPWHIRYAVELRGYVFTMLLGPVMLLCLLRALSTGRWRWWLGFAVSEFSLLYAYPGTLFMLVAANAGGLLVLWFRHTAAERAVCLPRLLVASTLAGMVWLQLMAPNLPQLSNYLKTDLAIGSFNQRWHMNAAAHFVSGLPWNNSDNRAEGYPELQWITGDTRFATTLVFGIAGLLLAVGLLRLLRSRPAGWLFVAVLLAPALLVYVGARNSGNYLYEWYLIFALPGWCACVAVALDTLVTPLQRLRGGPLVAALLLAAAVAGYGVFSQPARHWLITRPLQPIKDVVLLIRPSLDPKDPRQKEILTAACHVHLESYDPHVRKLDDLSALKELARQADAEDKPLFVVSGNDLAFSQQNAEVRRILHDPRHFERFERILGFDPTLTQTIWLYRPGSLLP